MKTTLTIPEKTVTQRVTEIIIKPESRSVYVMIDDPEKGRVNQKVDISDEWESATKTQRDIIKAFFKIVIKNALQSHNLDIVIENSDIVGELFEPLNETE